MAGSKYSNKKVSVDGILFDSKAEAQYYIKLKRNGTSFMELSGKHCKMQHRIILQDSFILDGKKHQAIEYKADFVFFDGPDIVKVVDVKGFQDAISKLKMKMFAHRYGFPVIFADYDHRTGIFTEIDCFEFSKRQNLKQKSKPKSNRPNNFRRRY